jgi:DNA polymerase-3 subunit beta
MKVICSREALLKGIQTVSPVANSKTTTLPVLANFLFETKGDKIKLSATDLEIAVQCYIKGEIVEEGAITIPAKRFNEIINCLPTEAQIEITVDESSNQTLIQSGKSKINLMGITHLDYPIIPDIQKENNFIIKKEIFISMIKKTGFAVSTDMQRFVLTGVYFIVDEGVLKMVATDGRRLAYITTDGIDEKIKSKAIIPAKAIAEMIRLFSAQTQKDETIKLAISENRCAIETDDIIFLTTLIEGIFPNYEQVIPKKTEITIRLNVKAALDAVRQIRPLTDEKSKADRYAASLKFNFDKDLLTISAATAGIGSGETVIEIDYKGEPLEVSFNPTFILEVLQNINEQWAKLELSDNIKPVIISPETSKNYLCVIMPMRV